MARFCHVAIDYRDNQTFSDSVTLVSGLGRTDGGVRCHAMVTLLCIILWFFHSPFSRLSLSWISVFLSLSRLP